MSRQFTPYETNQLLKYGFDPFADYDADIPVEYITNHCTFYSREFFVNQNVLIPRVETEEVVDIGLTIEPHRDKALTFADIGTGTGAIGLTFALELLKQGIPFNGYLSDISDKALEVAKINAKNLIDSKKISVAYNLKTILNPNRSKLYIFESDLLSKYPPEFKLDIIFANLPYIPSVRIDELDASVKNHEPHTALDGGVDGLEIIRKFLKQASKNIKKNGTIILEVDDTHISTKEFDDEWNIEVLKDVNDKNRFWIVR